MTAILTPAPRTPFECQADARLVATSSPGAPSATNRAGGRTDRTASSRESAVSDDRGITAWTRFRQDAWTRPPSRPIAALTEGTRTASTTTRTLPPGRATRSAEYRPNERSRYVPPPAADASRGSSFGRLELGSDPTWTRSRSFLRTPCVDSAGAPVPLRPRAAAGIDTTASTQAAGAMETYHLADRREEGLIDLSPF